MNAFQLLLASGSPRRRELLTLIGLPFAVARPDIDETPTAGEPADQYVARLSREKSLAISPPDHLALDGLIVTADTTVADHLGLNPNTSVEIIGKPADAQEATAILRRLRGRAHTTYTGVTLRNIASGELSTTITITQIIMRDYSDDEIARYVASSEPFDKAGAYGIQSAAFHPVSRLEGCYANVMGLPLCTLCHMLTERGVHVPQPVTCDPVHSQCVVGSV